MQHLGLNSTIDAAFIIRYLELRSEMLYRVSFILNSLTQYPMWALLNLEMSKRNYIKMKI